MGLLSFFNREVAMDLGTANSIVIYNDQVVIDEPSIVAYDRNNNRIVAVGKEAQRMDGRTDNKNIEPFVPAAVAPYGYLHTQRYHQRRGACRA